jgi:hypothetical protein
MSLSVLKQAAMQILGLKVTPHDEENKPLHQSHDEQSTAADAAEIPTLRNHESNGPKTLSSELKQRC